MHPRPFFRLVLWIGGWLLCVLALLIAFRLRSATTVAPPQVDSLRPAEVQNSGSAPSGLGAPLPAGPTPLAAVAPQPLIGNAAKDALHESGQYESLAAAFQAARYGAEKIDPAAPHSRGADYFAANPAQQLRAWFRPEGVELASGRPTREGAEPWSVQVRLRAAGRTGALAKAAPRVIRAAGSRVEMSDPEGAITEWYENKREGLEQGFTIAQPPPGAGPLEVVLGVEGNMRATEDGVRIADADGAEVVRVTGLKAWDANGRALASRMEVRGSELALLVADAGARYPVTIDPLFANIETRLSEDSGEGDTLGAAVAVDGNTAVLGAPLDSTPVADEGGSAYVFVRTSGVWRQQARLTAGDGAPGDRFGDSVALSGETALVGARGDDTTTGNDAGSAYVFARSGTSWTEQAKFTAPNGGANSVFGKTVAVSGETALVSADSHMQVPGVLLFTGVVYVFTRSGTTWSPQAQLNASDAAPLDIFGSSVALSGDTALLGASGDDTAAGTNAGSAYVFVRAGTTWSEQAKLTASDGAADDRFGFAVALGGDTAVVTANSDDTTVQNAGSAYVFVRTGVTWSPPAKLTASDAAFGDFFGRSVALSGDTVVVGAVGVDTPAGADAGSAHVFVRTGVTWSPPAKLTASDGAGNDQFGGSVALSGDTLLIGARFDDTPAGTDSGSGYVFTRSGTTWTQQTKLTVGDSADFNSFGLAVALDGDTALIGTPNDDVEAAPDQGSAHIFVRTGSAWLQQAKITGIDAESFKQFGRAVALDGDTALVGADQATKGRAYVFVRTGTIWTQQDLFAAGDTVDGDAFARSLALDGDTALVGAPFADLAVGTNAGGAYIFVRSGTTWSEQAKLVADDGAVNQIFGIAVALSGETALVGSNNSGAYAFVRSGQTWSPPTKFTVSGPTAVGFGFSVALSGETALIGAPGSITVAGGNAGSAYIFTRSGALWSPQARLTASDAQAGDEFGFSVALDGDTALIGAYLDDLSEANAGSAYVFKRQGLTWSQQVKLTAGPDASVDDVFGSAVALSGDTALVGANSDDTSGKDGGSAYVFLLGEFPAITVQPASRTVVPGTLVTFSVAATGYAPLSYRWRRNGLEIADATGSSYTIQVPVQSPFAAVEGGYDVVVSNIGGVATSAAALLTVNSLSEFPRGLPSVVSDQGREGFLTVNLLPPGLPGAQWRFVGEQQWRPSAVQVSGLTTSDRVVEFRPVPGYQQPLPELVSIISGVASAPVVREYFLTEGSAGIGGVTVFLKPDGLAGAQWRLLGENDPQWLNSGATRENLIAGNYLIECRPVGGRSTPPPIAVLIEQDVIKTAVATYFVAAMPTGAGPGLVPFELVNVDPNLPYQYVGQLRSEVNSGSGFVVRPRVVATAGHMVFDDGILSAVSSLQWLFQRDKGTYEPRPQIPRGFFLMTGYAARRALEGTPGESTPQSHDLDAAALYFTGVLAPDGSLLDDGFPGRGGFSGFLASDAVPNEWLTSSALKTLVGYPTATLPLSIQGRMHATPPANVAFTRSFGAAYFTTGLYSFGGNSGGPLCVQFEGGAYYPAGIFLSGAGQSVVRAIDSAVIALFDLAQTAGNAGPQSGDGGSTRTSTALTGSGSAPGSVKVTLQPAVAASASGGWRFGSGSTQFASGTSFQPPVGPGSYQVYYNPVAGFITPGTARTSPVVGNATQFTLASGVETRVTATYHGIVGHPQSQTKAPTGNTAFSVNIGYTPAPPDEPAPTYQWQHRATTSGATFVNVSGANGTTYAVSNISALQAGEYRAVVTWANGTRTSNAATLTVTGDTLDTWRAARFTAGELADLPFSGPLADPGKDGVNVLLAFALNLDPKTSDSRNMIPGTGTLGLPAASQLLVSGQRRLALEFVRRRAASAPGITYRVEFTGNLSTSTLWSATGTETVTPIDSTWERVVVTDSQPANPRRFGRLVVTQP